LFKKYCLKTKWYVGIGDSPLHIFVMSEDLKSYTENKLLKKYIEIYALCIQKLCIIHKYTYIKTILLITS